MNTVSLINPNNLGQVEDEFQYDNVDELAALISSEPWAPATFLEGKRQIRHLSRIDLLVLDVDNGCTLEDATTKFKDLKHIIATSRSHQKEKNGVVCDRFRVVLFLSEPITSDDDFKATWTRASKLFPFIDPACKDSARFFYPSPGITSVNRTGRLFDISIAQKTAPAAPKPTIPEGAPKGELWKSTLKFLLEGAPKGQRHHALVTAVGNMREQGYQPHEVIEALERMIAGGGDWTPEVTKTDLKTIERMYAREMKYGYVPPENSDQGSPVIVNACELIDETFEYLSDKDKVKGEPTGIDGLDALLGGGFRTGELTVLMAQAKTGKNTLYHDLIYRALEQGIPYGYASRELSPAKEVLPNLISIAMGQNAWKADVNTEFRQRARDLVNSWPLSFSPGYGTFPVNELKNWFHKSKDAGINFFLFDHFHYALVKEDHDSTSLLIRELKALTKELDIHISLIVQPRGLKEGEQLSLATLRGGAVIGQALDNLLILERVKGQTGVSKLTLEVARHKLARLGEIYLLYDTETTRFTEADRQLVHLENENTPRMPQGIERVSKYNGRPWPRVGQDS